MCTRISLNFCSHQDSRSITHNMFKERFSYIKYNTPDYIKKKKYNIYE